MRRLLPLLAGILMLGVVSESTAQLRSASKAGLELGADHSAYQPGATARVAAVVTIESGWHINSSQPSFEYLIPTQLTLAPAAGWTVLDLDYPPGELKTFAFEELPLSVWEGTVILSATLEVDGGADAGDHPLRASLRYQACDDRKCLPPTTAEAELTLRVGSDGQPQNQHLFAAAPIAPTGASSSGNLLVMLMLAVVGGLILNAMPCVLPVLSLKVFGLVKSAGKGRSQVVSGALATAAGIIASFLALAVAAIVARSAGASIGWGVQFQEPTFVAALTVLVLLFTLNLWGLFEISLPHRFGRLAGSGPTEGLPGHFASGLFATLMATPCSAPFLGTAVGFALTHPPATILAMFLAIGVGMALPYIALAIAPGAARLLPSPGPWMNTLRALMGFLLAAAAVWLLYVLSSQVSRERLAFIQLSLLTLALFIWLRHRARNGFWAAFTGLGALAAVATAVVLAAGGAPPTTSAGAGPAVEQRIAWTEFDRGAAEQLAAEGRLVFVDVTADWCFTCKVNERLVLETEVVADAFERHGVVAMKADWTNRSEPIARFLADHGKYGIPFYLLYRPGSSPHVFSELLNKDDLIAIVEAAASETPASGP